MALDETSGGKRATRLFYSRIRRSLRRRCLAGLETFHSIAYVRPSSPKSNWGAVVQVPERIVRGLARALVVRLATRRLVDVMIDITMAGSKLVIPHSAAREIVALNPDHIVVTECRCRAARASHCLPVDVCLMVGEPIGSYVMQHRPDRSRRLSLAEAIELLRIQENQGHTCHASTKEVMGGHMYSICNCCSCCCAAMRMWGLGTQMLASSGYVSMLARSLCTSCGDCVQSCGFGAIRWKDSQVHLDRALCMGCGVCVSCCPEQALSLVRDGARGDTPPVFALADSAQSGSAQECLGAFR